MRDCRELCMIIRQLLYFNDNPWIVNIADALSKKSASQATICLYSESHFCELWKAQYGGGQITICFHSMQI